MAKRRRRRKWSDDEKRMMCGQTVVASVSVAQVAQQYDLNANKIFNWLKNLKFAPDDQSEEDEAKFLPVDVIAQPTLSEPVSGPTGLIEQEVVNGHSLRIRGSYDPEAITRLVRHLT